MQNQKKMAGFTLIELLVVISIISLLISILLPALQQARESGRAVKCKNNLRQIGTILYVYAGDYDDFAPSTITTNQLFWLSEIFKYTYGFPTNDVVRRKPFQVADSSIMTCPSDLKPKVFGVAYSYSANLGVSKSRRSNGKWFGGSQRLPARLSSFVHQSNDFYATELWGQSQQAWSAVNEQFLSLTNPFNVNLRATQAAKGVFQVHQGGFNTLFIDGHVAQRPHRDLEQDVAGDYYWAEW